MRVSRAIVPLCCIALLAGCGSSTLTASKETGSIASPASGTVADPIFSPAPGIYSTTQTVTMSDATAGAKIYYTTDGSVPTTKSQQYIGGLAVASSQKIQAIAVMPQAATSRVVNADYAILPPVVSTSTTYDFGSNLVNTVVTRTVGTVTNDAPTAAPVTLAVSGDASFTLVPGQSCSGQVEAHAACPIVVAYDPTASGVQHGTVSVQFAGGSTTPTAVSLTGTAASIERGRVTPTNNPQVASYSIAPPFGATVVVAFGPTTAYGFNTSAQASPENGGPVSMFVAGMLPNSLYHMQATVTFADGSTYKDADHTFTTGAVPLGVAPPIQVTPTPGLTPQPGIELINTVFGKTLPGVLATDLSGGVLWTYTPPDLQPGVTVYPVKQIPNGDFIMEIAPLSGSGQQPYAGTLNVVREVDLAGNTVRQITMDQLNSRLVTAGFTGLKLQVFSHDITLLPNGHFLVLAAMLRQFANLPGYPGITTVAGDVVVDLDEDLNPVWVWNEFDHFDVNRRPMGFPDWTHSNAVIYSQDDGNFLVSIRHQNWVVKVNYKDGLGDGNVIWKLGPQGDFALKGGVDPTDWFYAQHSPAFFSKNTTGSFSLGVMDNGDDRAFPNGDNCLVQAGADCYTTIPIMQVDENAMTATLTSHQILSHIFYSSFAGDVQPLDNGNVEYNLAGVSPNSFVFEVTPGPNPQTVWELGIFGTSSYRAFRIPSLYPGVAW